MTPDLDLRRALDDAPMSRFQVLAIGLCVALNMLDGFDVLVMAFTAPEVAREWGLSGAQLGLLLSAGLVGMAAGYLAATAASVALFGLVASDLQTAFPIAIAVGVFLFGSMVALYAATPRLYPAAFRTTGMGWAIGIGRLGAVLAPLVAGVMVDAGWATSRLYLAFAVPLVLAILAVRALEI